MIKKIAATVLAIGMLVATAGTAEARTPIPIPKPVTGGKVVSANRCESPDKSSGVLATRLWYPAPYKNRDKVQVMVQDTYKWQIDYVTINGKMANLKWVKTPTKRTPNDNRKTVNDGLNDLINRKSVNAIIVVRWTVKSFPFRTEKKTCRFLLKP